MYPWMELNPKKGLESWEMSADRVRNFPGRWIVRMMARSLGCVFGPVAGNIGRMMARSLGCVFGPVAGNLGRMMARSLGCVFGPVAGNIFRMMARSLGCVFGSVAGNIVRMMARSSITTLLTIPVVSGKATSSLASQVRIPVLTSVTFCHELVYEWSEVVYIAPVAYIYAIIASLLQVLSWEQNVFV